MSDSPRIYVAGHRGMVGSAIVRQLVEKGHDPEQILCRTRGELDLTNQAAVDTFSPSTSRNKSTWRRPR